MYTLSCKHCGEKNEVESLLKAAETPCKSCGQPVMGDRIAPETESPGGRPLEPWEKALETNDQFQAGTRDAGITMIAKVNWSYGVLFILFAVLCAVSDTVAITSRHRMGEPPAQRMEFSPAIMAGVMFVLGLLMLLSGFGLRVRAPWARHLGLVVAGLAGLLFIGGIILMAKIKALIMLGTYTGLAFFFLLRADVAAEFGRRKTSDPIE